MATKKNDNANTEKALKTLDLIQEVVWAIRSRELTELNEGIDYLKKLADHEKTESQKQNNNSIYFNRKDDLKSLVGSMSLILADTELFPSNEHIAKFAYEALQITITRWEKRSRYEMIGMLIMESIHASPQRLRSVSNVLNEISNEDESMKKIKTSALMTGFSWNEAIRALRTSVE